MCYIIMDWYDLLSINEFYTSSPWELYYANHEFSLTMVVNDGR